MFTYKFAKFFRTAAFGVVATATVAVGPVGMLEPAHAAGACDMTPENFTYQLDRIATPTKAGWVASDGFNSVRLDSHTVLITAQDTFYGTGASARLISGTMKRNSILIYDDRLPGCFRSAGGTNDSGTFPTGYAPGQRWNWPGTPTQANGTVAIPMSEMALGNDPAGGAWNFALFQTTVQTFRWDGTNLNRISNRVVSAASANPSGRKLGFNSAKIIGNHAYLTASDLRPGQYGHDIYLARVPVSDWFAQTNAPLTTMEFLTKNSTWVRGANYDTLKRVVEGSGDASATIEHTGNEMHLIYKQYSILGNTIMDAHASSPEKTWTETPLMPAPAKAGTFSYHAVVHEAWSTIPQSLNRRVTLNFNNAEDLGWNNLQVMWRYRPELRDIVLPEKTRIKTGMPGNSTVVGNLTAIGSYYPGHVRAYPCDENPTKSSTNNFLPGQKTANFIAVKTDWNGDFCVDSPAPAHFVFDVFGSAGYAGDTAATRLLDTRNSAKLAGGSVTRVHTTATPGNYALGNLTVTEPAGSGHTRAYPCDGALPPTSVNNYTAGQTVPNFSATRTDPNGDICIYTSNSAHILYDYVGDTAPNGSQQGNRLLDTRSTGTPAAGSVVRVHTPVTPGGTVTGNLTIVQPVGAGHTRVWNCDDPMPGTSVNNYTAGETHPNFVAVKTNQQGEICIYNTQQTDVIFDYTGGSAGMTAVPSTRVEDTRR